MTAAASASSRLSVLRVQALLDADQWEAAGRELGPYLASHPEDSHALCLAAMVQLHSGDLTGARRSAATATRLTPTSEWAQRLLSSAELGLGRKKEAQVAADAAVAAEPGAWQARVQRSAVLLARGRRDAAEKAARVAVELAPLQPDTHVALGVVAAAFRPGDAEAAFREALRLAPNDVHAHRLLAELALRRRRVGDAVVAFRSVGSLDPADRGALTGVANAALHGARMAGCLVVLCLVFSWSGRVYDHELWHSGWIGREVELALAAVALGYATVMGRRLLRRTGWLPGPLLRAVLRERPEILGWLLLLVLGQAVSWPLLVVPDPAGYRALAVAAAVVVVCAVPLQIVGGTRWLGQLRREVRRPR